MREHPAKLTELEAIRGLAALVVLAHHSLLAFAPRLEGLFFPTERFGLFGTPFYAFVNGSAAVALFFVLSGFVLTYRIIVAQSPSGLGIAALKRWPRLAGPVVLVSFVAGLLAWAGLFANAGAAELSHSPWLANWYGTSPYKALPPLAAIEEGLVGTFFRSRTYFNGNLWTMSFELFGSFLAFAAALVVADLRRPRLSLALTAVFFVAVLSWNPYYATFVAGVGMAQVYVLCGERLPRFRMGWVLLAACVAFILFGFRGTLEGGRPVGFYAGLAHLPRITGPELQTLLHSMAALLIMGIVMSSPLCKAALGGRFGAWIGRMSFPIYLTHLIVICSAGSSAFIWLSARLPHAPAIGASIAATVAVTFAASYPVMLFDQWWVRRVNVVAGRLKPAPVPEAATLPLRVVLPASVQIPSQSAA